METPEGLSTPPRPEVPPGGTPSGPVERPHEAATLPALAALHASVESLEGRHDPIEARHSVSLAAGHDVSSYFTANLAQLRQQRGSLESLASFAISRGKRVEPSLQEALETINHLITVREGIEAWRNGSLQGKNPEERAKFLHKFLSSVVAIGAKSRTLDVDIDLISKAIDLALRDHPDTEADIFTALFDPSKMYSPAELEFLRNAIENKKTSGLGTFIVDCFQASLKTSSEAMLSSLRQFFSYCKSGGPAILELHQQAEKRIKSLQQDMVARRSERLGESREALHHSLGRVDRFLQAFHLLSQRSSSQAALACSQILDNLTVVIEDVCKKPPEGNKGKLQAEIAELEKDHTFQNILQANPLLKEQYLQLKSQLSTVVPEVAGEAVSRPKDAAKDVRSEMGKVGRFLGRIGLLGHLTPRRAQQACEVVITRLERVMRDLPKNVDSDLGSEALRATLSGLTIQIGELRSNPQFLSVVHSNEDLERRLNALESEVNELGILDNCRYEAKNAHTLSEKAQVAMELQQFDPKSPRAVEQKKLLCAEYSPEKVLVEVRDAMRAIPSSLKEQEAFYDELGEIEASGLFKDEFSPDWVRSQIERAEGLVAQMTADAVEEGLEAAADELKIIQGVLKRIKEAPGATPLAVMNQFLELQQHMQSVSRLAPGLSAEALAIGDGFFNTTFALVKARAEGVFFDAFVREMDDNVPSLPMATSESSAEQLEVLCAEADRLSATANKLKANSRFTHYLNRRDPASTFSQKVKDLEAKRTLYHQLLGLKQLEERAKKPGLSVLEKAQIAKDLQDLQITGSSAQQASDAKVALCNTYPFLDSTKLFEDLKNIVFYQLPQTVEELKKLFDDIGELQNLGLFASEKDKKRIEGLAQYREIVFKALVEASVTRLEANVGRGLTSRTKPGQELAMRMKELEANPEFQQVLSSSQDLRARYQKAVSQLAAQLQNPEKALQAASTFLNTSRNFRTIRDFESFAGNLKEIGEALPAPSRQMYEDLKNAFAQN